MIYFFLIVMLSTFLITGLIRRYAVAKDILDHPNERSSHSVATPRGGGMGIVAVFLIALPILKLWVGIPSNIIWALFGSGGLVAAVGFLDDHGHIPAFWRLLVHAVAAIWALTWLGGMPPLTVADQVIELGWFGYLLAVFYLIWLLNLYNFMDGIDGIAGVEALTVSMAGTLLYTIGVKDGTGWALSLLLAASASGFLLWNFPKARIFMGDAGSGFIGVILGVISIHTALSNPVLYWVWVILLGTFIVDATITLFRRVLRGERFYEAHRSHAYQNAARKHGSHIKVTIAVAGINVFWLLPMATVVVKGSLDGSTVAILAYLPLILLSVYYKAGAKELQE